MIEHQQDDDGVISCRYRTSQEEAPFTHGWCWLHKECCNYDPDCRVPIPTNLSLVATAAENLAETSENLVELMVDLGYDRVGSYREDLDAARKALEKARAILKNLELSNGQK